MSKNGKRLGFLPGWRIMSYLVLLFNVIMLIWVIMGVASSSGQPKDCGTLDAKTCNDAQNVGTAIGVTIVIALWVAGDIILGIIWLVTNRKKTRDCPVCGRDVKKGLMVCGNCGYDFRAGIAAPTQYGQSPTPDP